MMASGGCGGAPTQAAVQTTRCLPAPARAQMFIGNGEPES
jgi:hypothetical protein